MKKLSSDTAVRRLPDIGPSCVAYRMRMLSRVISGIFDEVLAPLQLKGSQLNVLATLAQRVTFKLVCDQRVATDISHQRSSLCSRQRRSYRRRRRTEADG